MGVLITLWDKDLCLAITFIGVLTRLWDSDLWDQKEGKCRVDAAVLKGDEGPG